MAPVTNTHVPTTRYALSAAILLLWFAAVFDPIGNVFMLRYVALVWVLAYILFTGALARVLAGKKDVRSAAIWSISLLMPLHGLIVGMIRGGLRAEFIDTSYLAAGLLLLLSAIYFDESAARTGIRCMTMCLRLLVVLILVIYATMALDLDKEWFSFFTERNTALLATREYSGIELPYIYFLASPMLIFLIAHDIARLQLARTIGRLILAGSSILAFALSGTRSHMILAAAYVPLHFLLVSRARVKSALFLALAALVVAAVPSLGLLEAFFSPSETSNEIKIGMLAHYANIFNDPVTFLFGQGYNAHAWSVDLKAMFRIPEQSKTELTYVELVRVYGVLGTAPFLALIAVVLGRLSSAPREYVWLFPALLLYLANSSLNPYLFSTNGMLPLGLVVSLLSLVDASA